MSKKIKFTCLLLFFAIATASFVGCYKISDSFFGSHVTGEQYQNAEKYSAGSFTYDAKSVNSVEIHWRTGSVNIIESDDGILNVKEQNKSELSPEAEVHYLIEDGVLMIQFCESGATIDVGPEDKKLTVEIPKEISVSAFVTSGEITAESLNQESINISAFSGDTALGTIQAKDIVLSCSSGGIDVSNIIANTIVCDASSGGIHIAEATADSLRITTSSGSVKTGTISANDVEIQTTSGSSSSENIQAENVKIGSTSGEIHISKLSSENIDGATTSGNIEIDCMSSEKADIKTTSGSIKIEIVDKTNIYISTASGSTVLTLPSDGAKIQYSPVSGDLHTALSFKRDGNVYTFGNGLCDISVTSTSGNLTIKQ